MNQFGKNSLYHPKKVIAIGDIHGEALKLENLLSKILPLDKETHIVFCGDLVNKGSDTPRVLEIITKLRQDYPNQIFVVLGNHDLMLLKFLEDGMSDWFRFLTLTMNQMEKSWNLSSCSPTVIQQEMIKKNIYHWYRFEGLDYYETPDCIITHAPLNYTTVMMHGTTPEVLRDKKILDLLRFDLKWDFADEDEKRIDTLIPKMKICGHQYKHHKSPRLFKMRAFIDTGCGSYPNRPLTALEYPSKKIIQSS